MKKVVVGNVKFIKPVIEKVVDIFYVIESEEKEEIKHTYYILTYDEMEKTYDQLIEEKKIFEIDPKLIVVDETLTINFGDEEIEKHYDSVIYYDEEWIKTKNPDEQNFEHWLVEFVDKLIFPLKNK